MVCFIDRNGKNPAFSLRKATRRCPSVILSNRFGITAGNAEMYATFILYGCWGAIYNGKFTGNEKQYELNNVLLSKSADTVLHSQYNQ